jgi:hypothetical protein
VNAAGTLGILFTVTAIDLAGLGQFAFDATTFNNPDVAFAPKATETLLVVPVIVAPVPL